MVRAPSFMTTWLERSRRVDQDGLRTQVPFSDDDVRAVWLCASWLLGYPDESLRSRLPLIREVAGPLPAEVRADLLAVVDGLEGEDPTRACAEYVETFDTRRRGCLYLTYFSNGDTRRRGMALLDVKNAYREAGLDVSDDELPDHLTYVLEFGAAHDLRAALRILLTNRAGVELLRLHLNDIDSPWAGALRAVCATLPPLDGDDVDAVRRLAAEGPDDELVGLSGYGDGSADMPPADMSPYAVPPGGGAPRGGPVFVPLSQVKGLQP